MGYRNERGNVFFALFGAVAVVGVIGAASMSIMRGPMTTMVEVNKRTQAESEMQIAAKLAVIESIDNPTNGSGADCDSDGNIEPIPARSGSAVPIGGGLIPSTFGVSKTDPWGTEYGYCVWDSGSTSGDAACNESAGQEPLLDGLGADDNTYTVISIISAGPDRTFDTICLSYAAAANGAGSNNSVLEPEAGEKLAAKTSGSDDIIVNTTYGVAQTFAGGLWTIKTGDPTTATTTKDVEVTSTARFGGALDLQTLSGSLLLPDEINSGVCIGNAANEGVVRRNTTTTPPTVEICDFSGGLGWVNVAAGAGDLTKITEDYNSDGLSTSVRVDDEDEEINFYVNGTGVKMGINATDIDAHSLNFSTTGTLASGNATITGTLAVTGTSDLRGNISDSLGDLTLDDAVVITGTTDAQGAISNSLGDISLNDNVVVTGTLNGQGAADFDTTLNVDGATTLKSTLDIQGNISNSTGDVVVADNLTVNGPQSTFNGMVDFNDEIFAAAIAQFDDEVIITNGPLTLHGDADFNANLDVDGVTESDDYTWNGNDFTPPTCTSGQYIWWDGNSWECATDQNDGSGGSGTGLGIWEVNTGVLRTKDSAAPWATGDFVVGSPQLADDGDATHDNRMFFDKSKGAFRAGGVLGTQWDDGNVGSQSVAFGNDTTASGDSSFASGYGSIASGWTSAALGQDAVASGDDGAMALGNNVTASGLSSFASGNNNTASGGISTALGSDNTASGDYSFATGYGATASGIASISMGKSVTAGDGTAGSGNGDGSMAIGLIDDAVTITTPSQVTGIQSMGIFMGDQDGGIVMSAANTMGLFGGKMVIDPAVPATQLSARGVIDVGAATDAVVLPSGATGDRPAAAGGTDVNGMIRYNSTTNKFEGYENGAWTTFGTAASGGGKWQDGTDANDIYYSAGFVGIGTTDPDISLAIIGTDAVLLPVGTTLEQPSVPVEGMIRFNSDLNVFEGYVDDGTPAWDPINTGSGGKWLDDGPGGPAEIYYSGGNVGVGTNDPGLDFDVAGLIRAVDDAATCGASQEGAIRYRSGYGVEYCDGTAWQIVGIVGPGINLQITPTNKTGMDVTQCGSPPCSGTPVIFTVTNLGATTSSTLSYSLTGDTSNFSVIADTCTGVTLDQNDTCDITIEPVASGNGAYAATLSIPVDNTPYATMSGTASGWGCAVGVSGWGGIVADCDTYGAGNHLIVMESGCDGTTNEPTCSGTDTVAKIWSAELVSIGSLVQNGAGDVNTVNLMNFGRAVGTYPAAEYCSNLIHNGYDDWFLIGSTEYGYISPVKATIGGFQATTYWLSGEISSINASRTDAASLTKTSGLYVRCARKEGVALPAAQTDTTPDTVTFATKFSSSAGATVTSDTVTVTGITQNTAISISGDTGAAYSINGGGYTSAAGTISWGDTLTLQLTSPAANTRAQADVTIGSTTFYFSVITEGDCGSSCAGVDKRVFVSNATIFSSGEGISSVDADCTSAATTAGIGGTWKTIASEAAPVQWAVNRIDYNWDRLVNMNGDVIATSPTDLWDGSVSNPIAYDENGAYLSADVRTQSETSGVYSSNPFYGKSANTTGSWINAQANNGTYRAYCMEATIGDYALSASPSSQASMDVTGPGSPATGTPVIFTITNDGSATTAGLSTSVSNSTNFALTTDNCAGQTLAAAATCTITVTPQAYADGNFYGTLTVSDTTNSVSVAIGMNGTASNFGASAMSLDDLSDVDTTTNAPTDGVALKYESASSNWVPALTDYLTLPSGATGDRPGTPANGMIRYNSTTNKFEAYENGAWTNMIGGGSSLWTDNTTHITRENFHVLDAGLAAGSTTAGLDGDGTYAFFDPDKGALRGGVISGGNAAWQDANVGANSFAWGSNTKAKGAYSAVFGFGSSAEGSNSFASGQGSSAGGYASTAMGYLADAGGLASVSMGASSTASGSSSFAIGETISASGEFSGALGNRVIAGNGIAGSGLGDGSMAFGLIDDGVAITTPSQVTGIQSMGIFMGDQDGLVMSASNTMGLFGGNMVIDPAVPATQLSARGVIDVGAATDAIVLPSGTTAQRPAAAGGTDVNGMIRYNSTTNKFEAYENGSWTNMIGGSSSLWTTGTGNDIYYNTGTPQVGIGTASPASTLEIVGSGDEPPLTVTGGISTSGAGANISLTAGEAGTAGAANGGNVNITAGKGYAAQGGDVILTGGKAGTYGLGASLTVGGGESYGGTGGIITLNAGNGQNGYYGAAVNINGGNSSGNNYGGNVVLNGGAKSGTGTDGNIVLADARGSVLVGTSSATAGATLVIGSTDSILLPSGTTAERPITPANGMIRYNTDTPGFEVYEAGAWVAMGSSVSDIRLKRDIVKLDSVDVLDRLAQVQGYTYRLKEGDGQLRYGVIAQELETIFPELVDSPENPDEMKSVRYQEFTALLVEATKELKAENDALKAELSESQRQQKEVMDTLKAMKEDIDGLKVHTSYGLDKAGYTLGTALLFVLMFGGMVFVNRRRKV